MAFRVTTEAGISYKVQLDGAQTVNDVVNRAYDGFDPSTQEVTDSEGQVLALAASIQNGSQIFIRASEQGTEEVPDNGMVSVSVYKLGRSEAEFEVPVGTTLNDAIAKSGFDTTGTTIYLNNVDASGSDPLTTSPARITLAGRVKGG